MENYLDYIIVGGIGFIIYLVILHAIIKGANQTTERDRIQLQNQKILALMAEKLGADVEKLNQILKP